MEEIFDTYNERTPIYKVLNCFAAGFLISAFVCIFLPKTLQPIPGIIMIICFAVTLPSMFLGGSSIKTYKKNGELIISELSVSVNEDKYVLEDLSSIEITAGDFKGRGSRGGISDGTGNKIIITPKDDSLVETRFVVQSITQRETLTQIMKYWRSKEFKIISNGIDLI